MTRAGAGALLVAVWLLLWGDVTVANVLSGAAVVVVLFMVFPPAMSGSRFGVHPIGAVRLAIWFVGQLLVSNILLIRLVFTRQSRIQRGVIAVPLENCSDSLMRFIAHLTALTPGTMTVELRADPAVIYVHAFTLDHLERARRDTLKLNDLVVHAFGTPEEVADLDEGDR